MRARLLCKTGELTGSMYELSSEATIGTSPDNDIVLYPKVISGKHARIYYDETEKCYFLMDLKSSNGTQVDGITVQEKERLGKLHVITLARKFDFLFHDLSDATAERPKDDIESPADQAVQTSQQTKLADDFVGIPAGLEVSEDKAMADQDVDQTTFDADVAPLPPMPAEPEVAGSPPDQGLSRTATDQDPTDKPTVLDGAEADGAEAAARQDADPTMLDRDASPLPDITDTSSRLLLRVESKNQTFELKEGENMVGRTIECDIFIDDPSVSRRHAILTCRSNSTRIQDLGSKNQTFLDSNVVTSEIEVTPGAIIRFGEVDAVLTKGN